MTIAEAWERFERAVLTQASPLQRAEMRKAFYAGAHFVFFMLTNGISEGEEIRESDIQMLEGVAKELDDYRDGVRRAAGIEQN